MLSINILMYFFIIKDLVPEGEEGTAGVQETEKTTLNRSEGTGTDKGITENKEGSLETGEPETQNEGDKAKPSPAFEFEFVVAGLAAAYRLGLRE
jgi:hypothetical protein